MKSPVARWIVWVVGVLICAVGVFLSLYLALLHYRTPTGGLLSDVCTAFEGSSCEKVAQSPWSWMPPLPDFKSETPEAADTSSGSSSEGKSNDSPIEGQTKSAEDVSRLREQATSRWWRFPTALLGMFYFTAILCWFVFVGAAPVTRLWAYRLFLVGTLLGLAGSAFYEYIMWTQMEAWCPLCVATHVGTLFLVLIAVLLRPGRRPLDAPAPAATIAPPATEREGLFAPMPVAAVAPRDTSALWPATRVVVMTAAIALVLALFERQYVKSFDYGNKVKLATYMQNQYKQRFMQYERRWIHNYLAWAMTPQVKIPLEGRPMRGSADAPRTMVIFSDFECPHCGYLETYLREKVMPRAAQAPNGGLKIYFKHWPLCKDCNEVMNGNTVHPMACQASLAVEAARLVGGDKAFWEMHDLLFEHQAEWKKSRDFVKYAKKIGLNEAAFTKAMASSEALDRVRADVADGGALGAEEIEDASRRAEIRIDSTPVVFVDGRRLDSWRAPGTWRAILGDGEIFKQLFGVLQSTAIRKQPATRPAGQMPTIPASQPAGVNR